MQYCLRTLPIVLLPCQLVAFIAWAIAFAVSDRRIADESIRLEYERITEEKFRPYIPPEPINPAVPYKDQ
jgi:hypothetical protein